MIGYLLGAILMTEAALLLVPTAVALGYGESITPFLITIGILIAISLPNIIFKPKDKRIFAREGFVTVAAGWILMSAFGALPFVLDGAIPSYVDAFFETASGLTTTGATILSEIESLPRGVLFWRSLTHWIGGMGVLVFVLAVLPSANGQTMHLMRAEVPGPTKGKLVPKMRHTALILYGIYVALTVAMTIALLICRMPLYDAVVNSFATAGTGGFAVLNNSIAGYNSAAIEWVVAVFMLIFGINFNLFFFIIVGKIKDVFQNEELKTYLIICGVATAIISVNTYHVFNNLHDSIRSAFFQVTSIMSTAGFSTADFNLWPQLSRSIIVILMFIGACAGSTAGGLKISRVLILLKSVFYEIRRMLRPKSVNVVRLDGEVVSNETVHSATRYFVVYIAIMLSSFLLISIDNFSFETNFTAVITCLNNVGPGLDVVGPVGNFSGFSIFSKIVLSLTMLIGRLEIMPMIILFSPFAWKKR